MQVDQPVYFDFHGILIQVISNDLECTAFIASDFSYFRVYPHENNIKPQFTLSVFLSAPPYEKIPEGTIATCHTKDAVVYKHENIHYFDSFGKILVLYDHLQQVAEIYSQDHHLLYEKSYLMIMSRVGELLDRKRLHRIHAMGGVLAGKAVLCLLPMGGGKTTLALGLLEHKAFSLLSEEVPLVSSQGQLYPFPIRMGVVEGTTLAIPEQFLKTFKRTHYQAKTLIDMAYLQNQIAPVTEPGVIFVGKRVHTAKPGIVKIPRWKALGALVGSCVLGLGVPQLLEYLLRFEVRDIVRQFPIVWSRLQAALVLLRRSETYELHLGYDRAANAACITDFLSKKPTAHTAGYQK